MYNYMNEKLKECSVCKALKPLADYSPDRKACRKCVSKINTQRIRDNPKKYEAVQKYQKQWQIDNAGRRNKYCLEWRKDNVNRLLLYRARARAKKQNIECSLTLEDIIVPDVCPVFKIPFEIAKPDCSNSPSLDRLNSLEGYTKKNTRVISCRANTIKNGGTREEHEMVAAYMKENEY